METKCFLLSFNIVIYFVLLNATENNNNAVPKINCTLRHKRGWHRRTKQQNGYYNYNYNPCVTNYYQLCHPNPCATTTGNKVIVHRNRLPKPIYSGPGKHWIGPKFGRLCGFFLFIISRIF